MHFIQCLLNKALALQQGGIPFIDFRRGDKQLLHKSAEGSVAFGSLNSGFAVDLIRTEK